MLRRKCGLPQQQGSQARTSIWKLVRLFLCCIVLGAAAAMVAAIVALVPYWIQFE